MSKPRVQKDQRPLLKIAKKQGWHVETTKGKSGHNVWVSPKGTRIVHAGSPSDWRSNKNLRAELRRNGLRL